MSKNLFPQIEGYCPLSKGGSKCVHEMLHGSSKLTSFPIGEMYFQAHTHLKLRDMEPYII